MELLESLGLKIGEVATIFVAVLALFVSINQSRRQIKHDKLSVKPHLDMIEVSSHLDDNVRITIDLANHGLGPAIVKRHKITLGEKGSANYREVDLKDELTKMLELSYLRTGLIKPGLVLPSDKSFSYLEIRMASKDAEAVPMLISALYEFTVEIEYESMYKESFIFSTYENTKDKPTLGQRSHREIPPELTEAT